MTSKDIVGRKVRLHSSRWVQGWCDGEVLEYADGVFYFQAGHQTRKDDPIYEVLDINQFTLLA